MCGPIPQGGWPPPGHGPVEFLLWRFVWPPAGLRRPHLPDFYNLDVPALQALQDWAHIFGSGFPRCSIYDLSQSEPVTLEEVMLKSNQKLKCYQYFFCISVFTPFGPTSYVWKIPCLRWEMQLPYKTYIFLTGSTTDFHFFSPLTLNSHCSILLPPGKNFTFNILLVLKWAICSFSIHPKHNKAHRRRLEAFYLTFLI